MSTIVVVAKDGYAAIAADTLTTWGSSKEGAEYFLGQDKIIQVGASYVAISGPTSAKFALKRYFHSKPDTDLTNTDAIFQAWLGLHSALKKEFFLNPREHESEAFESSGIDVLIA